MNDRSTTHDTNEHEALRPEIVDEDSTYYGASRAPLRSGGEADLGGLIALALSIASWVVTPIIGAIAALIIARGSKRRIRASDGAVTGLNIATAAQIIAGLNLLLGAVVVWGLWQLAQWLASQV